MLVHIATVLVVLSASTHVAAQDCPANLAHHSRELAREYPNGNLLKYLLDREGQLVGNLPSYLKPDDEYLTAAIEALL